MKLTKLDKLSYWDRTRLEFLELLKHLMQYSHCITINIPPSDFKIYDKNKKSAEEISAKISSAETEELAAMLDPFNLVNFYYTIIASIEDKNINLVLNSLPYIFCECINDEDIEELENEKFKKLYKDSNFQDTYAFMHDTQHSGFYYHLEHLFSLLNKYRITKKELQEYYIV